jgi:hypothetical protein
MLKNTTISVISCTVTTVILWFVAPSKRRRIMKGFPLSLMLAALWGRFLDLKSETMETNKLVGDVIKNNINTANHIKLDELDDDEDEEEDFREI